MLMPWKCFMTLYLRAYVLASFSTLHGLYVSLLRAIFASVGLVLDSLAPGLDAPGAGVRRAVLVLRMSAAFT